MKCYTALSFLAAAIIVRAQSSSSTWSSASSTSSASPLVPSGISAACSSFLEALNSNSSITSCITPIVNATSAFGPLANSSSNSSATADASSISTALNSLCATSSSSSCSQSAVRSQLASFYTACPSELTGSSSNKDVIRIYDVLYTLIPMKAAACTKDDSGRYCVTQISQGGSSSASGGSASPSASLSAGSKSVLSSKQSGYELVQNNLWQGSSSPLGKRAQVTDNVTSALMPNTTTFRSSNLAFLFLTPDLSSDKLCVACTRSVMSAYIAFEQSAPYAPGLSNSPILGGQPALYSAVNSTCGANFMNGAVQAAGGISDGLISGAAPRVSQEGSLFTAAAAAILGLAAFL
ncbi:hypothetical protein DFH11DRAFT_1822313 [Phellopilus nigrolimitatus]|nr:hypothetical protein DFH11DRAFT_1822313 [Phellopilus nigrolimitatus]